MARTPSNMLALNTKAPDFTLPDTVSGKQLSLSNLYGTKGTVIFFTCNHCPFVIHVIEKVVEIAKNTEKEGISFVAINSNDVENYPDDTPDKMSIFAQKYDFNFPYLYDESQSVAKAYEAACTPDFYLFDENLLLVYRGQLDDARPDNGKTNDGKDLLEAINHLLSGNPQKKDQKPSLGCNIKWKIG